MTDMTRLTMLVVGCSGMPVRGGVDTQKSHHQDQGRRQQSRCYSLCHLQLSAKVCRTSDLQEIALAGDHTI